MAAADSNVILRLLVRDDDVQNRAARGFLASSGHIFIAHVVLVEVVWALTSTYGFPKPRVIAAIERLLELEGISIQDAPLVQRALTNYRAGNADFSDCLILEIARRENELPLGTFDARLARLEGARKLGAKALRG